MPHTTKRKYPSTAAHPKPPAHPPASKPKPKAQGSRPAAPSGLLKTLPSQAAPRATAARAAALARFRGPEVGIPPMPPVRGRKPARVVPMAKGGSAKRGKGRG